MQYGFKEFMAELHAPGIMDMDAPLWQRALLYAASSVMMLELKKPARVALDNLVKNEDNTIYAVRDRILEGLVALDHAPVEEDLRDIMTHLVEEKGIGWVRQAYLETHERCNEAIRALNLAKQKTPFKKKYYSLLAYTSHVMEIVLAEQRYLCSLVEGNGTGT